MKNIKNTFVRDGYNSVIVKSRETLENGTIKLTLIDSAAENMANVILEKEFASKTVYLRENNSQIEWSENGELDWEHLCSADEDIVLSVSQKTGFGKNSRPKDKNVILVIEGNLLRFRAKDWLKEGYDIANDTLLRSDINGNFQQLYIREIPSDKPVDYVDTQDTFSFKCTGDNIPAISFNGTNIGALHGYNCVSSLPNDLGLDEVSIGEIFVRKSDNQKYMLVRANQEFVWFCPFDDESLKTGDFGKYAKGKNIFLLSEYDVITDENGKEYNISTNAVQEQFRFSLNHMVKRAFLDGVCEVDLTKNGVYEADFIDFYENYDIVYLPSILKRLRENKGKNIDGKHNDDSIKESYMNFSSTHRFHRNGSYTVYLTNTALAKISNINYLAVMSMPFSSEPNYVYAPESKNVGVPTYQERETIVAVGNPSRVRSFYHMTNTKGGKIVNVGYHDYEMGKADNRIEAVRGFHFTDEVATTGTDISGDELNLGVWYLTHKMYPYYYNKDKMDIGEKISAITYHVPAIPIDEDFFAINWHFVGDEIYLTLNCDKAVDKTVRTLPEYMNGLKISVEQKSDNFQINSDIIENNSISVGSNAAGYAILKLSKN